MDDAYWCNLSQLNLASNVKTNSRMWQKYTRWYAGFTLEKYHTSVSIHGSIKCPLFSSLSFFVFSVNGKMKLRVFSIKRKSSWNTPKYILHIIWSKFDMLSWFFCSVQQFLVKRNWTDRSWTAWAWITKSKTMKVLKVIIQIVRGEIKRAKWKISIMFDRSCLFYWQWNHEPLQVFIMASSIWRYIAMTLSIDQLYL